MGVARRPGEGPCPAGGSRVRGSKEEGVSGAGVLKPAANQVLKNFCSTFWEGEAERGACGPSGVSAVRLCHKKPYLYCVERGKAC